MAVTFVVVVHYFCGFILQCRKIAVSNKNNEVVDKDDEGNVCTKSQVAAAKAKRWTPYYYDNGYKEYEGSDE